MLLPLVTPVGANFMKDFPAVNVVNQNLIDAYAGPSLAVQPLLPWTPVLAAAAGDPVLGTGSYQKGYYYKIFDQVYVWAEFRFGTAGATFGGGSYLCNLPFPAKTGLGFNATFAEAPIIGNGVTWDQSASNGQPLIVQIRNSNQVEFFTRVNSVNRDVNPLSPMTWATQDGITFSARYVRDPS